MLVSVCIITFKRPEGLKCLLKALNELTFEKIESPDIEVIVVDNDTTGVANQICEELKPEFGFTLKTGIEPQQGITYARNKSVSMASSETDFIAFLDDDEIPESLWLQELLLVQREFDSDIVTGPVVPSFKDCQVPSWIKKGKFYEEPNSSYKTGDKVPVAFTNNVIVKAQILRELNPVFDNRFAVSGGSDAYLFLTLNKSGYRITWADKAIVYDVVSVSRLSPKWIILRGYRNWSTYSSIEKELYPSFSRQLIRAIKGFGLIFLGFIRLVPSLFMEKALIVTSLLYVARGVGTLGGLWGIFYQEYCQNPHFKLRKNNN